MLCTLRTLIAVRVAASTLLLGSAILIQLRSPGAFPIDPFFFLIGLTYALSVAYLGTLRFVERHPWLVDLQLGLDAVLVSAFISVTGGITSYFSSLFLLPIIATSTVRFRRGALRIATFMTVLYLALVFAQYLQLDTPPASWLFSPSTELPGLRFAQYTVAINLSGFFGVALLAGSLAERVRSADARLRRASVQIADLRAFNDDVIDSLLSGLVTTDASLRVLTFNRAASTITGVPVGKAFGCDAAELLQLTARDQAELRLLGPARSLRIDLEYRAGSGRHLDIGATATTLAFPDGRTGFLFSFQDVTDVRRLERDARLQQRLAAVGEMAAGIAHEIRNPLASMSGSIQVLRQELPLSEDQALLMDIVLRESERLNATITSFLAYARPQRLAVARLDVGRLVQDTALLLRNGSDVREGHVVDVDIPDAPVWYEADENQVRQILWNLATNGLRAMASGGRLVLTVRADKGSDEGGDLVLTVRDDGCGIPADQLEGLFQPFRSSFEGGTGLGLATVHRIVTDYKGKVQVSSAPGVGTTVRVQLPFDASASPARSGPAVEGHTKSARHCEVDRDTARSLQRQCGTSAPPRAKARPPESLQERVICGVRRTVGNAV